MENLLESNERTLVMFDAVCAGLASCLALVHEDIKHMTERRYKLVQIEQDRLQAKLVGAHYLDIDNNNHLPNNVKTAGARTKVECNSQEDGVNKDDVDDDDPHHLAGLKLLDKRLADSFSKALSMNEIHKSSIIAKQHVHQSSRPSIFQVLLGKSLMSKQHQWKQQAASKTSNSNSDDNNEQVDNKVIIDDINRQTRLAMQYSKQLEAHLFKVEDLRSRYEMHLKMGLVVKSVARAYLGAASSPANSPATLSRQHRSSLVINDYSSLGTHSSLSSLNLSTWSSSSSRSKANKRRQQQQAACLDHTSSKQNDQMFVSTISLNNSNKQRKQQQQQQQEQQYLGSSHRLSLAKMISPSSKQTTIKEFIENIDKIEQEFESYMGSFLLAIEDIQGFARICQGDAFEISIKYGDAQKFKTKISVLKENRQKCDNNQAVFKARISDVLAIKAYECKGLGKRLLLGHKLCETRDLFTARSQLMTISLNQTGSIKLNLVVTWNPLHLTPTRSHSVSAVPRVHLMAWSDPLRAVGRDAKYKDDQRPSPIRLRCVPPILAARIW